jgi:hypothetical protein
MFFKSARLIIISKLFSLFFLFVNFQGNVIKLDKNKIYNRIFCSLCWKKSKTSIINFESLINHTYLDKKLQFLLKSKLKEYCKRSIPGSDQKLEF